MKLSRVAGTTSQTVNVFIRSSVSAAGAGLTGLVFNSAGLIAYYMRPRAASVAITLATQTVTGAYSSGGFVEIDATHAGGWYRLDIPDAAMAASAEFVDVHLQGATSMVPLPIEIELTGWNNQDAVHGGLSCLPNTAVTTNGSLLTSGTGTAQITNSAGQVTAASVQGNVTGSVASVVGAVGSVTGAVGSVTGAVGSVTGNVGGNVTGSVGSVVAGVSLTAGQLFVKKNASIVVSFPMTDATTHLPATGLTVTAKRSIDGAAVGACANAVSELSLGLYAITLAASDTNGAMISLILAATGADTRFIGLVTQA